MSRQTTWVDGDILTATALNDEFDELYSTLAASGANADITSLTGLDDDGIPLAKVANAASDGANSDITSMTGLDDDGIPVAKIANGDIATDHIWAAAGDLVVGTGNDTAGVLSKGLANYKLFMNSGGATPEWGKGSHAGLFTRDISVASGDQAVTGLGFKPSAILFVAAIVDAPQSCNAIWSSSGSMGSVYSPSFGTATTGFYGTGDTLALIIDSSNNCTAIMKSADSDGFTLTWTKVGSPTGTMQIYYLAFR